MRPAMTPSSDPLVGQPIVLVADADAQMIPSGMPMNVAAGTPVQVTQAKGGHFTVLMDGHLLRIDASQASVLGLDQDVMARYHVEIPEDWPLDEQAWAWMKTCFDPEIPVNVVDLGLIYACNVSVLSEGRARLHVVMTLTAPGCGMGPVLTEEIKQKLSRLPGVSDVVVELVFDPPWDRSMMSEEAQLELGVL